MRKGGAGVGRVFTSDLYDIGGLAWAEQQTELLRQVAAGVRAFRIGVEK